MKCNIQICISFSVSVPAPIVIIDGPNVYYDRYCKRHTTRQCNKCKKKMIELGLTTKKGKRVYPDMKNRKWWHHPSLEISRLPIVIEYIEKQGYRPLFYCESQMEESLNTWLLRKYPDDVKPKRDLLEKLFEEGYVVFDAHGSKPHGADKEDDDNWDDDIWIIHMALRLREQQNRESFIMSNDYFGIWRKKRNDLDWNLIDRIHIKFEWQPEVTEFKEPTDQIFIAPKLRKLSETNPEIERKRILKEIQNIDKRREEMTLELESIEESLQEALAEYSITKQSEKDEIIELPYKEEIIQSINEAIGNKNRVSTGDIWFRLNINLVTGPFPSSPSTVNNEVKRMLGFKTSTPDKIVLQYMVNLFVNETGIELKPEQDWVVLDVIE